MPPARLPFTAFLAALALAGCTSTRQIQTARPQPAVSPAAQQAATEPRTPVLLVLETGATPLPDDVERLRFRIMEVQLLSSDSTWTTYPAELNTFELQRGGPPVRKTLLTTQLPPGAYDAVALTFGSVYAEYGPNAGGRLTIPGDAPVRVPLAFNLEPNRPATIRLTLEPGASLSRSSDCRWFLVPFLTAAFDTL